MSSMSRGVTRGWAGVLVPTLGFCKDWGLGWATKINGKQITHKISHFRAILLFAYPSLNPGEVPVNTLRIGKVLF